MCSSRCSDSALRFGAMAPLWARETINNSTFSALAQPRPSWWCYAVSGFRAIGTAPNAFLARETSARWVSERDLTVPEPWSERREVEREPVRQLE
jgi:hypothetical protein